MKEAYLSDFLTAKQIKQAQKIYKSGKNVHQRLLDEVVKPNMDEIDRKLGQENDAGYVAYAIEYALMQTR